MQDRLASGIRLERDEALHMATEWPLLALGRLAFARKQQLYGNVATYVINRQINPTNMCIYTCKFCDFAARPGDLHAYSLNEDDILRELDDASITEVHITGGLWRTWNFQRSLALVRRIRETHGNIWVKAFTAVEVDFFARQAREDWRSVLTELKNAGVDALPGGGAEVLSARIHRALYEEKIGPDQWLAIHEAAHEIGLPSNSTLLFGHIETMSEVIDHIFKLRALEDRAPGFQSFIPLAYQPGTTGVVTRLASPVLCLRIIAIARLILDNIPHIKAYWPTLQLETGASALSFGADDLDGTLGRERIMHLAGSATPAALTASLMERMIRDAGQIPQRRNGRFGSTEVVHARAIEQHHVH